RGCDRADWCELSFFERRLLRNVRWRFRRLYHDENGRLQKWIFCMIIVSCTPPVAQYAAAAFAAAKATKWHGEQRALKNRGLTVDWNRKQARFREGVFRVLLLFAFTGAVIAAVERALAQSNDATLSIEAKIPLGKVRGRIDHMAADIDRRRLFVA